MILIKFDQIWSNHWFLAKKIFQRNCVEMFCFAVFICGMYITTLISLGQLGSQYGFSCIFAWCISKRNDDKCTVPKPCLRQTYLNQFGQNQLYFASMYIYTCICHKNHINEYIKWKYFINTYVCICICMFTCFTNAWIYIYICTYNLKQYLYIYIFI